MNLNVLQHIYTLQAYEQATSLAESMKTTYTNTNMPAHWTSALSDAPVGTRKCLWVENMEDSKFQTHEQPWLEVIPCQPT